MILSAEFRPAVRSGPVSHECQCPCPVRGVKPNQPDCMSNYTSAGLKVTHPDTSEVIFTASGMGVTLRSSPWFTGSAWLVIEFGYMYWAFLPKGMQCPCRAERMAYFQENETSNVLLLIKEQRNRKHIFVTPGVIESLAQNCLLGTMFNITELELCVLLMVQTSCWSFPDCYSNHLKALKKLSLPFYFLLLLSPPANCSLFLAYTYFQAPAPC